MKEKKGLMGLRFCSADASLFIIAVCLLTGGSIVQDRRNYAKLFGDRLKDRFFVDFLPTN